LVIGSEATKVLDVFDNLSIFARKEAGAASRIRSVLAEKGFQSWVEMIGNWDDLRDAFQALERSAIVSDGNTYVLRDLGDVALEAPVASPTNNIYALGSNTVDHIIRAFKAMADLDLTADQAAAAKRSGRPPFGFTVWPSTVVGPGAVVAPPTGSLKFDYEAECAVFVKQGGRYLDSVDIWGYTAFNDFGVRDTHLGLAPQADFGPFSFNTPKNFDTGKSCGPWVVVDEGADAETLRCTLRVNGGLRQDWHLSEMIYSFNDALSYLSKAITLRPGDMLASGTGAGVALEDGKDGAYWLKPGDVVEVGLGAMEPLRNIVGQW
jgi:2-keto-4-pentenoate hydratase/2-oxohepta-3-ene-1,7-dioic acid hydratase in catechol pathway